MQDSLEEDFDLLILLAELFDDKAWVNKIMSKDDRLQTMTHARYSGVDETGVDETGIDETDVNEKCQAFSPDASINEMEVTDAGIDLEETIMIPADPLLYLTSDQG